MRKTIKPNQPNLEHVAVELRPLARTVSSLHEDPKNARQHGDENLAAIEASLRAHGQRKPIVVKDGAVIAGNGTLRAARKLGWEWIACVEYEGPDALARAYAIADNRAAEEATWDPELLAVALREAEGAGLLEATAFGREAADEVLGAALAKGSAIQGDDPGPEEPREESVSVLGEVYELGPHRLMCGDSTKAEDVKRLMGKERAGLMATDPPYLVDYDASNHPQSFSSKGRTTQNKNWDAYKDPESGVAFFSSFIRVAMEDALREAFAIYQWHASRRSDLVVRAWEENGLLTHQSIVWVKERPVLTRSHFMWQYEPCWYGWKQGTPPRLKPPANQSNVWEISQKGQQDGIHPTQKPTEIFEWPIAWHTKPGEAVYEPFCGSGSQVIAAAKLGRRCFAMELAPEFVDVIRRRWTKYARSAGAEPGQGGLE
jgi:DNA modification methylase